MTGRLVVLTGPSGVGKGTVVTQLLSLLPDLWLSRSATTRPPRPAEVPGEHYDFLTDAQFDALVAADGLLEWARFATNRYGTPRGPVMQRLATGQDVLLEIELNGARQVRQALPEAFTIFLDPPDLASLEARLRGRGTESEEAIQHRLVRAHEELAARHEFDAVVVNDDPGQAAREVARLLAGRA